MRQYDLIVMLANELHSYALIRELKQEAFES